MTSCEHCSIDIETYSSEDISKSGVYRYAEAPDFQILLIAYRFDDMEETAVVDLSSFSGANAKEAAVDCIRMEHTRLFYALAGGSKVILHAFNANFERTCLAQYFGHQPPERWRCTMVRAASLGLPMSLEQVGKALNLSEDEAKLKTGKALITYFCKPCKPTKANGGRTRNFPEHAPEKWTLFKEYNQRDVDAEIAIYKRLEEYGPENSSEQHLWEWDQRTNDYGVRLDVPYIEGIIAYDEKRTAELTDEAARLTGLANPNSVSQLKAWLECEGVEMEGITKETVKEALKRTDLPIKVRRVLEIRQALGKTSVKKYQAMLAAVCKDGRLRGILQFYGANRTGRWAGRIVQTHNLPQNHLDDLDYCRELVAAKDFEAVEMIWGETAFVFSELVRTAFIASEGSRFVVCDFSAVEARILGWLANEKWRMELFERGGDIYCESASKMYHCPVVKHGINGHLRQRGKVAELACIAEGSLVLTDKGLIPIEHVTKDMKVWDGQQWVSHNGVIYKGVKEVISYDGLEATGDHIVWTEDKGKYRQIRFGDAAGGGAHLLQSGAGGQAVRLAEDNFTGETISEELAGRHGTDRMSGLRTDSLDASLQHDAGQDKGLPELQPAQSGSEVDGQTVYGSKTALRESEGRGLQELRRERDKVRVSECNGSMPIHDRDERHTGPLNGDRPDRCERQLCSGQPQMGNASAKLSEPKKVYDILNAGPNNRYTVSGKLVHNCGYQGGVGAMKRMDTTGTIPEDEMQQIVDDWRAASPHIVRLWAQFEVAAKKAISEMLPAAHAVRVGRAGCVAFYYKKGCLFMALPSGRRLCYWNAQVKRMTDGREHITYSGMNQETKQWTTAETYGGKLVENCVQAIGRDCLADAMLRVADMGYKIVMHVHDEMIVDVPCSNTAAYAAISEAMGQSPAWAPKLLLRGDGYETSYYKKD